MRSRSLVESFRFALCGIVYALQTQRNMRIHLAVGAAVLIAGAVLNISRSEMIALFVVTGMVISAELFNTSIEAVVNLVTEEYHPLAAVAKNAAAGAVLVAAAAAVCVGYLVFVDEIVTWTAPAYWPPAAAAAAGIALLSVWTVRRGKN